VFHLVSHAFFKACLFLGAGSVISGLHHEQDMRKMGGLRARMPVTFWTFLIATLAIAGAPLTAGFFSKDEILWEAWSSPHGGAGLWLVGVAGAGLTACYMFRQLFLVFFGEPRDPHLAAHAHESPRAMTVPLVVLAAGTLLVGFLGVPHALGGGNRFAAWLAPVFTTEHAAVAHESGAAWGLMLISVTVAAVGAGIAFLIYVRRALSPDAFAGLAGGAVHRMLERKYWLDEIYQAVLVRGVLRLARAGAWLDATVIDGVVDGSAAVTRGIARLEGRFDAYVVDALVDLLANATFALGGRLRRLQTGHVNAYLYVAVATVTVVLIARLF
jgi:NADH-quinone oxidoreductase subunit L